MLECRKKCNSRFYQNKLKVVNALSCHCKVNGRWISVQMMHIWLGWSEHNQCIDILWVLTWQGQLRVTVFYSYPLSSKGLQIAQDFVDTPTPAQSGFSADLVFWGTDTQVNTERANEAALGGRRSFLHNYKAGGSSTMLSLASHPLPIWTGNGWADGPDPMATQTGFEPRESSRHAKLCLASFTAELARRLEKVPFPSRLGLLASSHVCHYAVWWELEKALSCRIAIVLWVLWQPSKWKQVTWWSLISYRTVSSPWYSKSIVIAVATYFWGFSEAFNHMDEFNFVDVISFNLFTGRSSAAFWIRGRCGAQRGSERQEV